LKAELLTNESIADIEIEYVRDVVSDPTIARPLVKASSDYQFIVNHTPDVLEHRAVLTQRRWLWQACVNDEVTVPRVDPFYRRAHHRLAKNRRDRFAISHRPGLDRLRVNRLASAVGKVTNRFDELLFIKGTLLNPAVEAACQPRALQAFTRSGSRTLAKWRSRVRTQQRIGQPFKRCRWL